jgi:hypothetical protein
LYAWDATNLTNLLYESDTNAKRDSAGPANKNAIPIITNGKVYVATHGQVDVYGLFNGAPNAVAPVITPDGGTFAATQSVTLTSTTTTASIYYTLDRSDLDQWRHNVKRNRERTRICPERRKQRYLHIHR